MHRCPKIYFLFNHKSKVTKNFKRFFQNIILCFRVGSLIGMKNKDKDIKENDPEEISFKDCLDIQESRLTINFIKVKSASIAPHFSKKSQLFEKISFEMPEPQNNLSPHARKSFHSKVNSETYNDKLFEKFLVIGVSKKDLIELEERGGEELDSEPQILPPKILYHYPKGMNEEL